MSFSPDRMKSRKSRAHVFAGFADAEQDKIVADTVLRSNSPDDLPKRGEGFDGVLGIVVVPRYTVEHQKRKELVTILLQSIFELYCYFALQRHIRDLPVEAVHSRKMPPQEAGFETKSINCFHHGPEQDRKSQSEPLQFFVVGVFQHVLVQVSDEMNQTLLLRARDGVVRIPSDGDRRSELAPIAIPNLCR